MESNVWSAWWKSNFDPNRYLYHYTTFETAIKILYNNSLRFSPLSETNDTTEQKLNLKYNFQLSDEQKAYQGLFEKYWAEWRSNSKLLCFCQDRPKSSKEKVKFDSPFDVRGRGFALPMMWAHYASKNCGVCLIIKKQPLLTSVGNSYPGAICRKVKYINWTKSYEISEIDFEKLTNIIKHNDKTNYGLQFLNSNPNFAQYFFFCKLKDWEGENEYRILLPNSEQKINDLFIEGVNSYLAGIVVGENADPSQIAAIKESICPYTNISIRRINFSLQRCSIDNIPELRTGSLRK